MLSIKNSIVRYNTDQNIITDYYNYILKLLIKVLSNIESSININLDTIITNNLNYNFSNNNKTVNVCVDYEHSLVIEGGRGVPSGTQKGVIKIDGSDDCYLVKLNTTDNKYDIIINYSMPNIINITNCGLYDVISKKQVYIAPCLYKLSGNKTGRDISILTSFINTEEPRGKKLLENIKERQLDHINISNCFDYKKLQEIYNRTKIVINIRQTDHHHTLEELRVLPAILNKVIVVCERPPLYEHVSYFKYMVFCNYDEIIDKTIEVLDSYDEYYDKIFNDPNIEDELNFDDNNYQNLYKKFMDVINT